MTQRTTTMNAVTIGMDLGDKFGQLYVLDAKGAVIEEGRIAMTPDAIRRRFGTEGRARVAIEAGTHSPWVSEILKSCGHEVLVANPRKLRLIYENDSKSDRADAQYLARLARTEPALLSPIKHRCASTRAHLAMLRARGGLVSVRTQLVNHVRGAVKSMGGRLPKCSTESFPKSVASAVPKELWPALSSVLATIASVSTKIRKYDKQIERLARNNYPETELLEQVTGVGPVTALTYVLTIEDPKRFKSSRAVGSYVGLRPRKSESGERDPQLRITKAGDRALRTLLVGSAHYILGPFGPDCDLQRFGRRLAERGGKNGKKRAIVAVARKLAVLLHRLWITGQVYDPLWEAKRRGKTEPPVAPTSM